MWKTVGQSEAIALIKNGLETDSLAHAYLLVGAPHIGKMTLALDLAKALNCQESERPCGQCQSCQRITEDKHTDIRTITLSSAKESGDTKSRVEISIDDIREMQRSASLPPFEGKYKVFIIDGAEYLSTEAANCLLKTIEEPPPQVVILLLASEESNLLPTVVSRCQRLELKPISTNKVKKMLIASYGIDQGKAEVLARLSQGCLGRAVAVSTDDSYMIQREQMLAKMMSLISVGWEERFNYAAKMATDRKSADDVIKLWLCWWRDLLLVKCGCTQSVTNIDYQSALEQWGELLSLNEIRDFIDFLQKSLEQIVLNANLRLIFEILMLNLPRKERTPLKVTGSV